jgi:hypothetical protein
VLDKDAHVHPARLQSIGEGSSFVCEKPLHHERRQISVPIESELVPILDDFQIGTLRKLVGIPLRYIYFA